MSWDGGVYRMWLLLPLVMLIVCKYIFENHQINGIRDEYIITSYHKSAIHSLRYTSVYGCSWMLGVSFRKLGVLRLWIKKVIRIDLETIILNEINLSEKDKYHNDLTDLSNLMNELN